MDRVSVWDLPSPEEYRLVLAEALAELRIRRHEKLVAYHNNEGLLLQKFIEGLGLQTLESNSLTGEKLTAVLNDIATYCPGELVEFFRRASELSQVPSFGDPTKRSTFNDRLLQQISVVADSYVSASSIATDEEDGVRIRFGLQTLVKLIEAGVLGT